MKNQFVIPVVAVLAIIGIFFVSTKFMQTPTQPASVPPAVTEQKAYTAEEVAAHNTEADCWMIINNSIYDVTSYLSEHPGGNGISVLCGQDATIGFATKGDENEPHSEQAQKLKEAFLVGTLK